MRPAIVTSLALLTSCVIAQELPQQQLHQQGRVRIFYHTTGQHAVDLKDANQNKIPDQVEDAMTQTLAAQGMFVDVLGFPNPFLTERFHTASFLDIHFRHKDTLKVNGVAFDELQRYKRPIDPPGTTSLCFNVATSVKAASNLTPSHEFFHLIQYGTTYFKNGWFTEGTARWAEQALGAGALGPAAIMATWPLADAQKNTLFVQRYDAAMSFWNPLIKRYDSDEAIPGSPELTRLQAMRYVDGSSVLKDTRLAGWRFIRDLLKELDDADDIVFRERGYSTWLEKDQSAVENSDAILQAVSRVISRYGR